MVALLAPAAQAVTKADIQAAVARGVAYLRRLQAQDGNWTTGFNSPHNTGINALAALTLLECGVPEDDSAVQRAAAALREVSTGLTDTYSISTCLLFFDRLGEQDDIPLIESLTVQLLAAQDEHGGWGYFCPSVNETEVRRLKTVIEKRDPKARKRERTKGRRSPRDLAPEIQQQVARIERNGPKQAELLRGDNSNTQFATLALWVGRRYGLPVDKALARVESRFRAHQTPDGGWCYLIGPGVNLAGLGPTAAMTCSGLLGLAVAHGLAHERILRADLNKNSPAFSGAAKQPGDPNRDPALFAALRFVVRAFPLALVPQAPVEPRPFPAGGLVDLVPVVDRGAVLGNHFCSVYYFLWSLERVSVAFGLQTLAEQDWYAQGSAFICQTQAPDGSWQSKATGGVIDTCFALLFLQRANLAPDLTTLLRGRMKDPGVVRLRAGGVGGEELRDRDKSPGHAVVQKPASEAKSASTSPAKRSPEETLERAAARLSAELVSSPADRQDALLRQLREGKGTVHTEALAAAIPQLRGSLKVRAREALAERLSRMTAATLRDKLTDPDVDVRRAAALACAMKDDRNLVPDLIKLLDDREALVWRAASTALKSLTGHDLGPKPEADRAERSKAMARWRSWWADTHAK
jgi:hypothetical protein